MYRHIIPININDNGRVLGGMLKRRNAVEAGAFLGGMILIFKLLFFIPLIVKLVFFVIIALLPSCILAVGIGDESAFEYVVTSLEYRKMPDIIPYKLPAEALDNKQKKE